MAENDVIEYFYAQGLTGGFEFLGYFDLIFDGCDIVGGAIAGDDDGCGTLG